jgi:hypothetical protein
MNERRGMQLSEQRIKELQELLKQELGLEYSTEQAQIEAIAIMRFVAAKNIPESVVHTGESNGTS